MPDVYFVFELNHINPFDILFLFFLTIFFILFVSLQVRLATSLRCDAECFVGKTDEERN